MERGLEVKTRLPVFWGWELNLSANPKKEIPINVGKNLLSSDAVKLILRGPAGCMTRNNSAFIEKFFFLSKTETA